MQARHEYKHRLNYMDYLVLRARLSAVLSRDQHAGERGEYMVRSLYFDTPSDRALREKIDGVNHRDKYRIRLYGCDPGTLHLEKKSKHNGLCYKVSAPMSEAEAQALMAGDLGWMLRREEPLLSSLYVAMTTELLRPRTIVDYVREPFVYGPGNVRITLDRNIRTGMLSTNFLRADQPMAPVQDDPILLEVKYDAFLPRVVQDVLQIGSRSAAAFSKYAACRVYG